VSVVPAATDPGQPAEEHAEVTVPAVVVVVVARDPGPWFGDTLASLAAQDYPNLSVLVVDAGSSEPVADRVAAVLPDAFLHRLSGNAGFSAAANRALELVTGASFLLFCHDDVALDARCVSVLVEEAYRSNAGICGPKLVQWDDPERLLQLGMASDRFGMLVDQVDRGELDQEQYDAVRDVFLVPGGVQLIRSDLFRALGGFDAGIPLLGEDLDLCWRGHVAGARVVVVPDAVARHLEALALRRPDDDRRRLQSRHRLRSMLVTSSRWTLVRLLPLALLLLVVEGVYALMAGRRRQAREVFGAVSWNLSRLDEIRARRREVMALRRVPDREVHALQLPGSARFVAFFRDQVGADRLGGLVGSVRDSVTEVRNSAAVRDGALLGAMAALLVVIGSRNLITQGFDPLGQVPRLPDGSTTMLGEWLGGWRSAGLGAPTHPPSAFALLGALHVAFAWFPGLLQTLLVVGPLAVGAVGAWRLLRPFASPRAAGVAVVLYAASPLVTASFAAARWDALVLYAGSPFVLGSLLRLQGVSPYGDLYGGRGPGVADRSVPVRLVRLVLVVALLAAFVPGVVPLVALVVVALVLAGVLAGRPAGVVRLLAAIPVTVVGAVALHLPWGLSVLRELSWSWLVGPRSPEAAHDSLADLARFATGRVEPTLLALGLLAAAALPLLIGRSARLHLALGGWFVALAGWAVLWVDRRGWLGVEVPAAEVVLTPVLAGLVLAAGIGVVSIDWDLRRHGFGWRQSAVVVAACGVVASGAVGFLAAVDGRWEYPRRGFLETTALISEQLPEPPGRVLWIGSPRVLPLDGWALDAPSVDGPVSYAVTGSGRPDATSRWVVDDAGRTSEVGRALQLAADGDTVRLGRLLALYGIDVVVVVPQLAPTPYQGPSYDVGPIGPALAGQLDLERLAGAPDLVVYHNRASQGAAVALPEGLLARAGRAELAELLDVTLDGATRVPVVADGPARWSGEVPEGDAVLLAVTDDGRWEVDGVRPAAASGFGGLLVVEPGPGGDLQVHHPTPVTRRLLLLTQLGLVVIGVVVAQWRREELVPE
jgi:GT2 family glycosyltransferase